MKKIFYEFYCEILSSNVLLYFMLLSRLKSKMDDERFVRQKKMLSLKQKTSFLVRVQYAVAFRHILMTIITK